MSASTVEHYLDQPLDDLLEELALCREQATGGPTRGLADTWDPLVPALRRRVCVEWNWCERRQDNRFEEHIALATLISQIVAPEAQAWQVPAGLIGVILVKKGLDAFCRCPPVGARTRGRPGPVEG